MRRPSRPGLLRYCLSVAGYLFVALLCVGPRGWSQISDPPSFTGTVKRSDSLHVSAIRTTSIDSVSDAPPPRRYGDENEPPVSFAFKPDGGIGHHRDRTSPPRQNAIGDKRFSARAGKHQDYSAPKTSH